jgi:hypothetical protein
VISSDDEDIALITQESFGFHLEQPREQFKPHDAHDHEVLLVNKMMN